MSTSHHGIRAAVKARRAAGGVAAFIAVCEAAHVAAAARGVLAGAAVVVMVFLACWAAVQYRQIRHPAPARRRSRGRGRELVASPPALAESQPTQLAA